MTSLEYTNLSPSAKNFVFVYSKKFDEQNFNVITEKSMAGRLLRDDHLTFSDGTSLPHPKVALAKNDVGIRHLDRENVASLYDKLITSVDPSFFHEVPTRSFSWFINKRYTEIRDHYIGGPTQFWLLTGVINFFAGVLLSTILFVHSAPIFLTAGIVALGVSLLAISVIASIGYGRKEKSDKIDKYDEGIIVSVEDDLRKNSTILGNKSDSTIRLTNVNAFADIDKGIIRKLHKGGCVVWTIASAISIIATAVFGTLLFLSTLPMTAFTFAVLVGLSTTTVISAASTLIHLHRSRHSVYPV